MVLARKDAPASYHLCVTHDDALQGVTLVTRGRGSQAGDPPASAAAGADGLAGAGATPTMPLLTDATGRRLAKRDRAATLADLRAQGVSAAEVRARAGVPDQPSTGTSTSLRRRNGNVQGGS